MSTKTIIDKFDDLPPEAKKQAADFVAFLHERYVKTARKPGTDKSVSESPFVGMWAEREDMADSTEWVRKQRKKLWIK